MIITSQNILTRRFWKQKILKLLISTTGHDFTSRMISHMRRIWEKRMKYPVVQLWSICGYEMFSASPTSSDDVLFFFIYFPGSQRDSLTFLPGFPERDSLTIKRPSFFYPDAFLNAFSLEVEANSLVFSWFPELMTNLVNWWNLDQYPPSFPQYRATGRSSRTFPKIYT